MSFMDHVEVYVRYLDTEEGPIIQLASLNKDAAFSLERVTVDVVVDIWMNEKIIERYVPLITSDDITGWRRIPL